MDVRSNAVCDDAQPDAAAQHAHPIVGGVQQVWPSSYWSKAEGVSVAPAIVNGTLLVEARGDRLAAILGWIYSHAGLVDIDAQGSVIACMYHNDNASVLDHRAKPLFFEDGKRRKPVYEDAHFAPLAGPRILCEHCVAREITHVINVATPKSKKDASARKRPRTRAVLNSNKAFIV